MTRNTKITLAVIGVIIVAAPVTYVANSEATSLREIAEAKAKLKAFGHATTEQELLASAPPEGENAASIYRTLFGSYDKSKLSRVPLNLGLWTQLEGFLDDNRALLDRVDQVRSRPKLWFDRDYSSPSVALGEEIGMMRGLAKWVGMMAALDARRGHPERALERLKTVEAIAAHLNQDPLWMGGATAMRVLEERDMAAILVAEQKPGLPTLLKLRAEVSKPRTTFRLADHLGAEALQERSPSPPDGGPMDQIRNVRFIDLGVRARRFRTLAKIAELGGDGLSPADMVAWEKFDIGERSRDHPASEASQYFALYREVAAWENRTDDIQLALAVLDTQIQSAGGPAAKIPSGIVKTSNFTSWTLKSAKSRIWVRPNSVELNRN